MLLHWSGPACLVVALVLAGCAAPPDKEMNQAQGALDAARAAGAERYATDEYRAATDALARSREAVTQRDYRLALNNALDSRERAQNAAHIAADTKAQVRVDVDRTMAAVGSRLAAAHARLAAAEKARVPGAQRRQAAGALAAVNADVQKAGEAVAKGDYLSAQQTLKDVNKRIAAALTGIQTRAPRVSGRRRGQD